MLEPIQFISASAINVGLVLAPAFAVGAARRSKPVLVACCLTLGLFIVQALVLTLPTLPLVASLKMNWLQKLGMVILTIIAARLLGYKREEWGLKPPNKILQAIGLGILFGFITTIPAFIDVFSQHEAAKFKPEYFLFELTMPGLHEEPLYRGLLLCIWDKVAGRPWNLFGQNIGAGAIISAALFVLGHTFTFDHDFQPMIAPFWVWLDMTFFALAMTWLRYKCDSVGPPLMAHNLGNAASHLAEVACAHH